MLMHPFLPEPFRVSHSKYDQKAYLFLLVKSLPIEIGAINHFKQQRKLLTVLMCLARAVALKKISKAFLLALRRFHYFKIFVFAIPVKVRFLIPASIPLSPVDDK
jgi:hypothetical protein